MTADFDILVAGAGPAGLAAACLFAAQGRRVAVVAPSGNAGYDPRTMALMQPQVRILERIGLWPAALREASEALRRLRMVDDTGSLLGAPTLTFDPAEIGEQLFGWNIPLARLVPALAERAEALGVTRIDAEADACRPAPGAIEVSAGSDRYIARLAIAADGRKSVLRDAASIRCERWTYEQSALATSFSHSGAHDGVSTEYHRGAGPCTTVPLPGNHSALVWLERPARIDDLMALDDNDLAAEIQIATHGELGRVSDIGPRRAFAMEGLSARSYAGSRTMLIGETAHVFPPIGAQGLNMSLRDAAAAADVTAGTADPGAADLLHEYDAARRRDIAPRQTIIHLMNRSLLAGLMPLESGRAIGLDVLANFGPLRRYVMRRGLGPASAAAAKMAV